MHASSARAWPVCVPLYLICQIDLLIYTLVLLKLVSPMLFLSQKTDWLE